MRKIKEELKEKLLRLVSLFEVGGDWGRVAGNFDGQILSFGPLQWNIGQGTLQKLLKSIKKETLEKHLGKDFVGALYNGTLKDFVIKNVLVGKGVKREWSIKFANLAKEKETIEAFKISANNYFRRAQLLCEELGFESERALALCFDIAVQNGAPRRDHINEYNKRIKVVNPKYEWEKLKVLAYVVADLANPRWRNDVLSRKLSIAVGEGVVHGHKFNLKEDFDIDYYRKWYETN